MGRRGGWRRPTRLHDTDIFQHARVVSAGGQVVRSANRARWRRRCTRLLWMARRRSSVQSTMWQARHL